MPPLLDANPRWTRPQLIVSVATPFDSGLIFLILFSSRIAGHNSNTGDKSSTAAKLPLVLGTLLMLGR